MIKSQIFIIIWKSRNFLKRKNAETWCRNFGLSRLATNIFIGELSKKEKVKIEKNFLKEYRKKTDIFYLVPLCKECYGNLELCNFEKEQNHLPDFKIV